MELFTQLLNSVLLIVYGGTWHDRYKQELLITAYAAKKNCVIRNMDMMRDTAADYKSSGRMIILQVTITHA